VAALRLAAFAGCGGLLMLAVLAARTAPGERAGRTGWVRRLPWELALLAASGLAYLQVRRGGAVRVEQATVHVSPWVLAFPLLALGAATVLFARGGTLGLARVRRAARRLPAAAYLAVRRLTGMPLVAAGAVVGITLPIAVLLYSSALTGSTSDVVQRKVQTNVGAPYAFGTLTPGGVAPDLRGAGTVVSMIQVDPRVNGAVPALVLALDPATFARYAYGGPSVARLVQRLTPAAGAARAVLVNAPSLRARTVTIGSATITLDVVARTPTFPGLRDPYSPLVVVNRAALPRLDADVDLTQEVWTDQPHLPAALAALHADGVDANYEISPMTFLNSTGLRPVTWLFEYLRALAYLIGLIAVAGLGLALAARTRRHALAYHLSRRMGLTRRRHRRSLLIEVGGLLATSWLAACTFAMAAIALVYRLADPYPASPPPPVLPVPVATASGAAAACVLLGAAAVILVQRALDRVRPAALLRAGTARG
jgi:putative ABC transport system permease protein